jgi:2-polyprenyl-3-methyl-5-hydroxy-6-metoxy-1,4-benzoquinol methylase
VSSIKLTARIEAFDTFWEAPENIEKGFKTFQQFYKKNYLKYVPHHKDANILIVSCGTGYFVNLLDKEGYRNVLGIDSDPKKVKYAQERNLNCKTGKAFDFLKNSQELFDVIICEQELNHLTKDEMVTFLRLCWDNLQDDGLIIVHGLNGANPITGAEALAQNFDHFNTFTEYSLRQVLKYCGFDNIRVIPLNLYVFYNNPLNYLAMLIASLFTLFFRFSFILYGKSNKIFTKKIGGIAKKGVSREPS